MTEYIKCKKCGTELPKEDTFLHEEERFCLECHPMNDANKSACYLHVLARNAIERGDFQQASYYAHRRIGAYKSDRY